MVQSLQGMETTRTEDLVLITYNILVNININQSITSRGFFIVLKLLILLGGKVLETSKIPDAMLLCNVVNQCNFCCAKIVPTNIRMTKYCIIKTIYHMLAVI